MKTTLKIILVIILSTFLYSCRDCSCSEEPGIPEESKSESDYSEEYYSSQPNNTQESEEVGLGVTTTGKVGLHLGDGLILTSDGELGIGIGF